MTKSTIDEIRELEASIEGLRAGAVNLRKTAETIADPSVRNQLLMAAEQEEASLQLMLDGLQAMRKAFSSRAFSSSFLLCALCDLCAKIHTLQLR